ncbi:MAG TPA: DUF4198 domain-containing protein [Gemmatimonadales bacterium]|jgi:hypothetical protein|nr:DUF4198 domain-containing protein [Gemmatimonadales bacterium]
MRKHVVLAALLLLATTSLLLAHDLFLKLESYFVPPRTPVRIAVLNGSFTASEGPVTPDRLRDLSLVGNAGRVALPRDAWRPQGDTTWLTLTTGAPGTYVVGASLLPREIALAAKDFNAYLEEDGIPDVLAARTRDGELTKDARERYQKHVKAIFQVGDLRTRAFETVLGYPAEIVPLTNPYFVIVGDTLAVRCLLDGQPVAQQLVIAGGTRDTTRIPEVSVRSDTQGVARFVIRTPGKWYIKFIHMVPVRGDSVNYESKWATLTFQAR